MSWCENIRLRRPSAAVFCLLPSWGSVFDWIAIRVIVQHTVVYFTKREPIVMSWISWFHLPSDNEVWVSKTRNIVKEHRESRPRTVKAWNADSNNQKLRKLGVSPCSPGSTTSSRKRQVLAPKHFRKSVERQPAAHVINGWFVTATRMFCLLYTSPSPRD